MPAPLPDLIRDVTAEALALAAVLGEVDAVQWQSSPSPAPRDDTAERSKGGHSDPTAAAVADERRLMLREAVRAATASLEDYVHRLRGERLSVERALARWEGN